MSASCFSLEAWASAESARAPCPASSASRAAWSVFQRSSWKYAQLTPMSVSPEA
jgi:hypothetical protein